MINDDNKTEVIDQYLNGQLHGPLLQVFVDKLTHDPDFKLEVEAQKAVIYAVKKTGEEQLKQKFKQFHSRLPQEAVQQENHPPLPTKEIEHTSVRSLWNNRNFLAIAASLLLLLTAGAIIWMNINPFSDGSNSNLSAKSFYVPVTVQEETGLGYAGAEKAIDSVIVALVQDSRYTNHYQFKDTLKIYSRLTLADSTQVKLIFDNSTNTYLLHLQNRRYRIDKGFNRIMELTQIKE